MTPQSRHTAIRSEGRFWWLALSSFVSAMSLVSVTQHALRVGISPVLEELLFFYRSLTYPIFDLVLFWLPFKFAPSIKDIFLATVLSIGIQFRHIWLSERGSIRTWQLRFYLCWFPALLISIALDIYLPAKLFLDRNLLSEGFEAVGGLAGFTLIAAVTGIFIMPLLSLAFLWLRAKRKGGRWDTEYGRLQSKHACRALGSYALSLLAMAGLAAGVFAVNFQAPLQ
jgi:hypothetical protein